MTASHAGEDAEKLNRSDIAGGNADWHSPSGKQFDNFLKTKYVTAM